MFVSGHLRTVHAVPADCYLQVPAAAEVVASFPNHSKARSQIIQAQVEARYDKMLHPPLTYLGDAFQYRAPDGKFNSVLHPHLG